MHCREFRQSYSEFRDERISNAMLRRSMETHLARCTACAGYHGRVDRGISLIYESGEILVPPGFRERVLARVAKRSQENEPVMPAHAGFTVAAMMAAAVAIIVLDRHPDPQPTASVQSSVPAELVQFPQLISPPASASVDFTELGQPTPPLADESPGDLTLSDWVERHP
ncbi:MAG: anti-sigma factor family protein [Gemmatimonadales bacterium]